MSERIASIQRKTKETDISARLNIDVQVRPLSIQA